MSGHRRIAALSVTLLTTGLVAATGVAAAAPPLDHNKNAQSLTLDCGNQTLTGTTIAHNHALVVSLSSGGNFVIVQVLNGATPLFTIPGAVATKNLLACSIDAQPGLTFRGFVVPGS